MNGLPLLSVCAGVSARIFILGCGRARVHAKEKAHERDEKSDRCVCGRGGRGGGGQAEKERRR